MAMRDLLRLLPAVLAVLLLSGPRLRHAVPVPLEVLVDRSPSMAASTGAGTRLARGLKALPPRAVAPRIRLLPQDRPGVSPRAGAERVPASELTRAAAELLLAGRRVLLVSHREPDGLDPRAGMVLPGDALRNGGITACAVGQEGALLVRGLVARAGRRLVVTCGPRTLLQEELSPGPFRRVLEAAALDSGRDIEAALQPTDANPLDDRVVLLPGGGPPRIGLPSTGLPHLYRAFRADPELEVVRGPGPVDLRVGRRAEGEAAFRLLVAPVEEGPLRTSPAGLVQGVLQGHGPLRGFPLGDARLEMPLHALERAPQGLEPLLTLDGSPVLVRRGSICLLLHDPADGGWSRRRSFPLVVAEIPRLLGLGKRGWQVHRGGSVVRVPRDPETGPARVREPGGGTFALEGDGARFALRLDQPGVYRLETGPRDDPEVLRASCAVLDPRATSAAAGAPGLEVRRPSGPRSVREAHRSLEPWLAVLALLLLLLVEAVPPGALRRITSRAAGRPTQRAPAQRR